MLACFTTAIHVSHVHCWRCLMPMTIFSSVITRHTSSATLRITLFRYMANGAACLMRWLRSAKISSSMRAASANGHCGWHVCCQKHTKVCVEWSQLPSLGQNLSEQQARVLVLRIFVSLKLTDQDSAKMAALFRRPLITARQR